MRDTEADTCRKYVLPKLYASGWDDDQISEQKTFTDGGIIVAGNKCFRKTPKRADYLLRYRRDFMIAVIEAKASFKKPGDGLQQAKDYAETLGLKFAYSTNGYRIVEHDYLTGKEMRATGEKFLNILSLLIRLVLLQHPSEKIIGTHTDILETLFSVCV